MWLIPTDFARKIEGYPSPEFIDLVLKVKPEQVTLVPDAPDALTSSAGWNVGGHILSARIAQSGDLVDIYTEICHFLIAL